MPSTPNTQPTVITDKNGKVTTVHKKPIRTATPSIPPVASLSPQTASASGKHDEIVETLLNAILKRLDYDRYKTGTDTRNPVAIEQHLRALPDQVLSDIAHVHSEMGEKHFRRLVPLTEDTFRDNSPRTLGKLHEMAYFYPRLELDAYIGKTLIEGLDKYVGLPASDNYAMSDDLTKQKCLALMKVCYAMLDPQDTEDQVESISFNNAQFLTKRRTINIVMENLDATDRIISFIEERQMWDADLVEEMLKDDRLSALDSGIL